MANYVVFAIAAVLAVSMLVLWVGQWYKRRASQGGRRY
jgi:hypothetical protein